jgi:flagellar M-ring protein FliF
MTSSLATADLEPGPRRVGLPPVLQQLLAGLGPAKLAVLAVSAMVLVALFAFLILRLAEPRMTLLFGELDPAAAREIVGRLDALGVPYTVSAEGRAVLVPEGEAAGLRLRLAEGGLPATGPAGYELLDGLNPLTSSDFLANVSLRRALEGELARTIAALRGVREARVHLVQPKRELFEREAQPPSASVFLARRGAGAVEPRQVQAIRHLVAAAVPGLQPERVTVVDDAGTLLARAAAPSDTGRDLPVELEEARAAFETRLRDKVTGILERSLGAGKAQVEVSADLDFDQETTTVESFDPESQVARSTHAVEEAADRSERGPEPPVTVTTNLPTERTQSTAEPGSTERTSRSEETTNFEVSRTVRNHTRKGPKIRRLSVAVQVDAAAAGPEGTAPLEALVRTAAGLDAERGDVLEIVARSFAPVEIPAGGTGSAAPWLGLPADRLIEMAALLALAAAVVLFGLRPIARELGRPPATALDAAPAGTMPTGAPAAAGEAADHMGLLVGEATPGAEAAGGLPGAASPLLLAAPDGSHRARLLDEVQAAIDERPEDAIRVLRAWLDGE